MRRLAAALVITLVLGAAAQATDLVVYFLDVGHGDAILVDFGRWEALVDAGGLLSYCGGQDPAEPDSVRFCIERESALLASLIDGALELAVLTHCHEDHYAGLEFILDHYCVLELWESAASRISRCASPHSAGLKLRILEEGCPVRAVATGDRFFYGPLTWVAVLPDEPDRDESSGGGACCVTDDDDMAVNLASLVLVLTYGQASLILPSDYVEAPPSTVTSISLPSGERLLALPHHGRDIEAAMGFADWALPSAAVISDEPQTGETLPEAMERLQGRGIPCWFTALQGSISAHTDGTVWYLTPLAESL